MKSRKEKEENYEQKYGHIPKDYYERLHWLYDTLNIDEKTAWEIIQRRNDMLNALYFHEINIVLFEEPEGSPRPRFRLINRKNFANTALANPNFVHVYSITGKQDNNHMKRLVTENDFMGIDHLICTPCDVEICSFFKTPSCYNRVEKFLAEIGLDRHIYKPDWDNAGKKYSDMFNYNVWLDDSLVIDGTVRKYYSALPRIEIKLKYMNMLYNRHQYSNLIKRIDHNDLTYFGRKET